MDVTVTGVIRRAGEVPERLRAVLFRELVFSPPVGGRSGRGRNRGREVAYLGEDAGGYVVPRGYGKRLLAVTRALGIPGEWRDLRVAPPARYPERLLGGISLRWYQEEAITAALAPGVAQGHLVMPTGAGKSLTACELIRRLGVRALVTVHNQQLLEQWRGVIRERFGIEPGVIGAGEWRTAPVTVATVQTIAARLADGAEGRLDFGVVVVDECHHAPSGQYVAALAGIPSRYRFVLTATPTRADHLGQAIPLLVGPLLYQVRQQDVAQSGGIVQALVRPIHTGRRYPGIDPQRGQWGELVTALAGDAERLDLVARVVRKALREVPALLVLVERQGHAEALGAILPGGVVLHGGMPAKRRNEASQEARGASVVVGTRGLLGEGADFPGWGGIVLASPMSGEGPTLQGVGRVLRPAPGKEVGIVWDLIDDHPFAWGAWSRRKRHYRSRGFRVERPV